VLAQVNSEKITVEEFNKEVEKVDPSLRDMVREEPLQYLEGLIMKRIVLQEARNKASPHHPRLTRIRIKILYLLTTIS